METESSDGCVVELMTVPIDYASEKYCFYEILKRRFRNAEIHAYIIIIVKDLFLYGC